MPPVFFPVFAAAIKPIPDGSMPPIAVVGPATGSVEESETLLIHYPQYRALVCRTCKYALNPIHYAAQETGGFRCLVGRVDPNNMIGGMNVHSLLPTAAHTRKVNKARAAAAE